MSQPTFSWPLIPFIYRPVVTKMKHEVAMKGEQMFDPTLASPCTTDRKLTTTKKFLARAGVVRNVAVAH
jgi:hypothetical protein